MKIKYRSWYVIAAILVLLIAIIFLSDFYKTQALNIKTDPVTEKLKTPIYLTKNSRTYKITEIGKDPEEIAPVEGTISNGKRFIAYTLKKKEDWGIEPFIYIYDIETTETNKIEIEDSGISKFVHSWSQDDSKLLLLSYAQSVGEVEGYIYDFSTGELLTKLNLYSHHLYWKDQDSLIYIESIKDCKIEHQCTSNGAGITSLNSRSNEKERISRIIKDNNKFPIIYDLFKEGNILTILGATKEEVSEPSYGSIEKKFNIGLDLRNNSLNDYNYEDNFKYKLKIKIPPQLILSTLKRIRT